MTKAWYKIYIKETRYQDTVPCSLQRIACFLLYCTSPWTRCYIPQLVTEEAFDTIDNLEHWVGIPNGLV